MNKKLYDIALIDAPWEYDNKQQNDPKRGGISYPTLAMQKIYNLEIGNCMKKNSAIICWVTLPKLLDQYYEKYDPLSCMRHWGFRPVVTLFVWIKTNKNGAAVEEETNLEEYDDFYSGLGRYTNSNVEIAILARRGKGVKRVEKNVKQLLFAPIRGHSEKPQEQYQRIHRLFGEDKDYIELFARDKNPPPSHWDRIGLDCTPSIDIRDFLKGYKEHAEL